MNGRLTLNLVAPPNDAAILLRNYRWAKWGMDKDCTLHITFPLTKYGELVNLLKQLNPNKEAVCQKELDLK